MGAEASANQDTAKPSELKLLTNFIRQDIVPPKNGVHSKAFPYIMALWSEPLRNDVLVYDN